MGISLDIPGFRSNGVGCIEQRREIPFTLLAFLLVVIHFVFLMLHFEPAISTPDAQGYFAQAKLIATQGKTYVEPESILEYIGPHWLHGSENHYFTTFPPGLPAILAVAYKTVGPRAALVVNPLMASLSLLGLFLLCRLWIGAGWALLAAGLMAVNPFANEHALFGDSHTAVAFFLIWALFFLFHWMKTRSPWWALGTGLFVGTIPTIRYPELLFCLGFGIFVFFCLRRGRGFWRSLISGVIGAAVPIGLLCIRNQSAFGAFWKTGYALANGQTAFGWHYFVSNSVPYLRKIMSEGCGLVFGLGVIGIAILCARHNTRKQGVLFAMLVVPITLVYMSYCWRPDPQSMRFLLPTFFIYTIAGVWLLHLVAESHRLSAWVGSVVLLLITVFWGLPQSLRSMQHLKQKNGVLAHVTRVVEKHVDPGSILITNEGINQHLDLIGHWRLVDASPLNLPGRRPPRVSTSHQNIPTRRMHRNIEARLRYGNLTEQEAFGAFSSDVWQWAGESRRVYSVATEEQIRSHESQLSEYDKLVTIAKIEIPRGGLDNVNRFNDFRPPMGPGEELMAPRGPMGPSQIFDFHLSGEPLLLVEWTRDFP